MKTIKVLSVLLLATGMVVVNCQKVQMKVKDRSITESVKTTSDFKKNSSYATTQPSFLITVPARSSKEFKDLVDMVWNNTTPATTLTKKDEKNIKDLIGKIELKELATKLTSYDKDMYADVSILELAVLMGYKKVVRMLMERAPELLILQDAHGYNPLHYAVEAYYIAPKPLKESNFVEIIDFFTQYNSEFLKALKQKTKLTKSTPYAISLAYAQLADARKDISNLLTKGLDKDEIKESVKAAQE